MRYYLILLLVLLSSVPAFAEEARFFVETPLSGAQSWGYPFARLYESVRNHDYRWSYTQNPNAYLTEISLGLRVNFCYYCSSVLSVCVHFNNDVSTLTCQGVQHSGGPFARPLDFDRIYPVPDTLNSISSFTVTTSGSSFDTHLKLRNMRWEGGALSMDLTKNLLSLRGTGPINLGRVREITDVTGATEPLTIRSNTSKAIVWFDDQTGASAITRTITSNYNDFVYACLDSDVNGFCDYSDEQECRTLDKDWLKGDCCGDAPYISTDDCGWFEDKKAVCGQDSTGFWKWAGLEDVGLITQLDGSCSTMQIVSDGQKFHICEPATQTLIPSQIVEQITQLITIEGHEYICDGTNIAECGGDAPYSPNAKQTGDVIEHNNAQHYCTTEGTWRTSLDQDENACTAAGFTWTGTKCCGEVNDPLQTYEDQYTGTGTAGACLNNQFVPSGTFLDPGKTTINYRGEFFVCDPSLAVDEIATASSSIFQNTTISPMAKGPCGQPLQGAKLTGIMQNVICMPSGEWWFISDTEDYEQKNTAWSVEEQDGCCPENQCWDGQFCKDLGEYHYLEDKAYRCQATDWVETSITNTWDRKATGVCAESGQCLVSNAFNENWDNQPDRYWSELSNDQRPKCIASGQYISDDYCNNGQWSSRTKLVATQLLAIALDKTPTDFSLYCDHYSNVLNKYDYRTDYGLVTSFLRKFCLQPGDRRVENCVNSICVMNYGNEVAFGIAINADISGPKSPLQALNQSNTVCDGVKNQNSVYDPCGNNIWYNHNTESIIYAKGISPLPGPTSLTTDFFITPFNKLKDYVFGVVHKPEIAQYNYSFFQVMPQFKKVYMAKDDIDFVYAFKESNLTLSQLSYAGWYFSNLDLPEDTCSRIIKRYDSRANCEEQPSTTEFYIAAHMTPPLTALDKRDSIVDAWHETTGKIRVSP